MWLILAAACAIPYEEGQAAVGEKNCALAEVCGTLAPLGGSYDECLSRSQGQAYDAANCPDYDAKAMRACLAAYDDAIEAEACDADFVEVCRVCGSS